MANQSSPNRPKQNQNDHSDLKNPPKPGKPPKSENEIRREARDRAKKRPLIQRIVEAIKGDKKTFKELIINEEPLETRVALIDDGILEKFVIERKDQTRNVGAIFKGKIQNLEPGLKAAFVDIGEEKNAFLHYWDIIPESNDSAVEIVRDNTKGKGKPKLNLNEIPEAFPIGTDIVVQITKDTIGTKGPRTTTNISLPGRFIVLMPYAGQCGISRKIEDKAERKRLKKIIQDLTIPEGMGIIMRTAGEGKKARYFVRDLHILLQEWQSIEEKINTAKKPTRVYQDPDLITRTVRDFLTEEIDRVQIDNKASYDRIIEEVSNISPRSRKKIVHFHQDIPIFERFNIERQIEQTFLRKVPLPSGGELVFDETEALVAIDINTGGHKGKNKDGKDFILNVNLEAAKEICRQICLRNIGGLIIIDFIDMKSRKDRNAVYACMKREMADDKAKNHILQISQLGIMQMTRQRHEESNASTIYQECPYCHGRGIVKSPRTMSVEIQRRLFSVLSHLRSSGKTANKKAQVRVLLHPSALERLKSEDESLLLDMERTFNVELSFRSDANYHVENFRVIDVETEHELR